LTFTQLAAQEDDFAVTTESLFVLSRDFGAGCLFRGLQSLIYLS